MKPADIIEEMAGMEIADLQEINRECVDIIKRKRKAKAAVAIGTLAKGMKVRVLEGGRKLPAGLEGTITKVNVTRCLVDFGPPFQTWDLPPALFEVVPNAK